NAGLMPGAFVPIVEAIARYGYLGVHLFFIISGFVILYSAQDATPRSFLASRAARLYPAFWIAATLTSIVVWVSGNPQFAVGIVDYLVNLSLFPHWFDVPYVDGAYWSLACELHFYLLVWLVLRLGLMHRIEPLLAAWLLVSLLNAWHPVWRVEFWLDARWAPYFVAGCLAFLIRRNGFNAPRLL
ncbi:MAG TPA: acyltransferase family protein, partial [Rhodocyclaceae bacterium]|nr:acyltransferase family protein [Rhodocyclaceae bacterium]